MAAQIICLKRIKLGKLKNIGIKAEVKRERKAGAEVKVEIEKEAEVAVEPERGAEVE